jgi:hypothetical protein
MQLSELIATLQNEVAKSYSFISETRGNTQKNVSVLRINIEQVEVELPVIMRQVEVDFDPKNVKNLPVAFKKLAVPFLPLKNTVPKKPVTGKSINADIIGYLEKTDDRVAPESVGRIKINFKLVLS